MFVVSVLTILIFTNIVEGNDDCKISFPKGFIFGASTSAYQVEGAWNENGKGESNWDRLVHTNPSFVNNNDNGDVACDAYHKYKEDVQLLKHIGFSLYRFSISWPRILPNGSKEIINQDGIRYYNNLINELISNGIEPMVTLYHWDHPQNLEDIGGWLNFKMVDYFEDFADIVFTHFGDRVKWWITINEPLSVMDNYGGTSGPPALNLHGFGEYEAGHNLLKAHARAYHLYNKKFKLNQRGKVSFALNGGFGLPFTNTKEDIEAAERFTQFTLGWFAHPVYSINGDYPLIMRSIIKSNSINEGLTKSRLPVFTKEEIENIQGTYDYMGFNHYSSYLVMNGKTGPFPSFLRDMGALPFFNTSWPASGNPTMRVYPEGFRLTLNWLKNEYGNPPIFITENGYSDTAGEIQDFNRIDYFQTYLGNMSLAIKEDGCNVIGYSAWSLLDNFEWKSGYSQKFGLVHVDFNDPNRTRTLKKSAEFFKTYLNNYHFCNKSF